MANRPYIFCHMLTSLDGKISGKYMDIPECEAAGNVFYDIAFGEKPYYKHQGWLSGRVTTDDNFTFYKEPELDEHALRVPEGDYIAKKSDMYYVSVDPSGKLGWEKEELVYSTTHAHVIEVLTEKASNAYKDMLRRKHISYVIVGKETINYELLLAKLKDEFGIETLMLGGGGVLNWSFIQAGLCDEVSIVLAPSADGNADSPALFDTKKGLTEDNPVAFELAHVEVKGENTVWLRYLVK